MDSKFDSGFFDGLILKPNKNEHGLAVIRQSLQSLRDSLQLLLHVDSLLWRSMIALLHSERGKFIQSSSSVSELPPIGRNVDRRTKQVRDRLMDGRKVIHLQQLQKRFLSDFVCLITRTQPQAEKSYQWVSVLSVHLFDRYLTPGRFWGQIQMFDGLLPVGRSLILLHTR
jgi:hypothetical protein